MSAVDYDEIAEWYDESVRSGPLALFHELVLPSVLDLAGDVEGRRVCDLACGQGITARRLAERGATVVGVDLSSRLLDHARRYEREKPHGISYILGDAQVLTGVANAEFDGVVCNAALMDIPDLDACLCTVARILRPGGWFVLSITHPCFINPSVSRWARQPSGPSGWETGGYFAEGFYRTDNPDGVRGKVGAHHRTLSTYVNALVQAGLTVERLAEPQAKGTLAERIPYSEQVPPAMVVRCRKSRTEAG